MEKTVISLSEREILELKAILMGRLDVEGKTHL